MPPKRYFDSTADRGPVEEEEEAKAAEAGVPSTSSTATAPATKKERRAAGGPRNPQTTLFVSSLPFTATSTDLITLFSDIGPLRRAFVVKDKESGKSKGVGYITFAIREDAERALEELQGRSVDGGKRKMRVEWATGRFGEEVEGEGTTAKTNSTTNATTERKTSNTVAMLKPTIDRDSNAVRTIIMTGLGECKPAAETKSIYKRARKIGDVDNVIYPAPTSFVSPNQLSNDVAHVVYRTPNHAQTAVAKLHAHTFKGAQISVVLKKRADGAARLDSHMRPETKAKRDALKLKVDEEQQANVSAADEKAVVAVATASAHDTKADVNRGSRLIIRNLPFDITDRDLRAIFLPYGPIYSIDVPQKVVVAPFVNVKDEDVAATGDGEIKKEDDAAIAEAASAKTEITATPQRAQGRGFAFVWHVSRTDAAKALEGVNGTQVGHGAAEKAQLKAAKGKAGREAAKKALEEVTEGAQPARKVAVDWALSKKDWELKKDESEAEETEVEGDDDDDEDGSSSSSNDGDSDEDDESEDSESNSDLDPMELDSEDDDETAEEEAKPALPKPDEGTTLFIRNLPYQTTEDELRTLFRSFGPLRYAKVTMDKATKRPKGTAFICYWQRESADKAMQQAHLVEHETGTSGANAAASISSTKKNPFSATSILTADASAPLTASLSLHGRVLSIVPALDRSEADSLANAAQSAREKKDKRNTFLMREGVPMPNSPLAARLNDAEIERRLTAFQMRKTQLTKNPSLFISKTRLSVRQLPLFVTDKVLKRLAEHAVAEFDRQVAAGEREALADDEVRESRRLAEEIHAHRARKTAFEAKNDKTAASAAAAEEEVSKKQMLKQKRSAALQRRLLTGKGGFVVVQSKIIRAKDRLDATTGLGRSHGYGFLEVATFADALKIVRFANANKAVRKLMLTWYAEELGQMATKLRNQKAAAAAAGAEHVKEDKKADVEKDARLRRIEKKKSQLDAGDVDPEEEGTRGGLLVVEFSVENVVTVKRRSDRLKVRKERDEGGVSGGKRPGQSERERRADKGRSSGRGADGRPGKRTRGGEEAGDAEAGARIGGGKRPRRPETWNQKTNKPGGGKMDSQKAAFKGRNGDAAAAAAAEGEKKPVKQGAVIGSIIGRKRKMRKA